MQKTAPSSVVDGPVSGPPLTPAAAMTPPIAPLSKKHFRGSATHELVSGQSLAAVHWR